MSSGALGSHDLLPSYSVITQHHHTNNNPTIKFQPYPKSINQQINKSTNQQINSIFALFPSIFSKVETSKNNLTRNGITKGSKQARTGAIVSVIGLITAIAMNCGEEDVSFVLGIVGSVLGCGVAYVLPGYLNMKQMRIRKAKGLKNEGKDVLLSHVAVLVGLVFGSLGAYVILPSED